MFCLCLSVLTIISALLSDGIAPSESCSIQCDHSGWPIGTLRVAENYFERIEKLSVEQSGVPLIYSISLAIGDDDPGSTDYLPGIVPVFTLPGDRMFQYRYPCKCSATSDSPRLWWSKGAYGVSPSNTTIARMDPYGFGPRWNSEKTT